ncbi:MAG: DUF1499 domain-containing protein [Deltaproteobacteria bacterium]|nr:DUF1499 domain-containing protein [Deltaproteobacteria bacterium]
MATKYPHHIFFRLSFVILLLAVVSALAGVSAGLGTRLGLWAFGTGFTILRFAAYGGLVAALSSLIMLLAGFALRAPASTFAVTTLALLIGGTAFYVPLSLWREARRLPVIHDITTDTDDPPQFKAVLPLRRNVQNPSEYGGEQVALKQRLAYPDIKPLILPGDADAAFDKALGAAKGLGWEIVDADKGQGRIEATDTTLWFGFKDDIVVRITPLGQGSARIDVRSVSRVGRSDIGKNAQRVRKYLGLLSRG